MKKKNIIISSIIALLVLIGIGIHFSLANDDYTCYTYTSTVSSCLSNKINCTPWANGERFCDGTNITTYTASSTYTCGSSNNLGNSYSVNGVCRVKYTDTQTPNVTNGGIR